MINIFIIILIIFSIFLFFIYKNIVDTIITSAIIIGYECDRDTGVIEDVTTRYNLYKHIDDIKANHCTFRDLLIFSIILIVIGLICCFLIWISPNIFKMLGKYNHINLFLLINLLIYTSVFLSIVVDNIDELKQISDYTDYYDDDPNILQNLQALEALEKTLANDVTIAATKVTVNINKSLEPDFNNVNSQYFDLLQKCSKTNKIRKNGIDFYKDKTVNEDNEGYVILDHRHKDINYDCIELSSINYVNHIHTGLIDNENINKQLLDEYKKRVYGKNVIGNIRQFHMLWIFIFIMLIYIIGLLLHIIFEITIFSIGFVMCIMVLYIYYSQL